MPDILSLLQCLLPKINATTMRQLNQIILAMLAMSHRVTMLGISCWAGIGGSYRIWFNVANFNGKIYLNLHVVQLRSLLYSLLGFS